MSEQDYEYLDAPEDLSQIPVPGKLVRQTREQRGLSIDDMSARTRLTDNVLHMVERDDYLGMGEPVYARGYYRKCAEALGLNGDLLVEAYERHSGTMSPVPTIDQRPSIAYREGPGRVALAVAIGLILVVFAISALWLWDKDGAAEAAAQTAPSPVGAIPTPQPSTAPVERPARTEVDASSRNEAPMQSPLVTPAPTLAAVTAQPTPEVRPTATPQASAAAPAAAPVRPEVRVEVQGGEAWLDVRDPSGNKLLYKLLQPGSVREFTGQPPFKLSLGRADNVRIWVQGQPVEFKAQIESDLRAFFYIDAQGRVSDEVTP